MAHIRDLKVASLFFLSLWTSCAHPRPTHTIPHATTDQQAISYKIYGALLRCLKDYGTSSPASAARTLRFSRKDLQAQIGLPVTVTCDSTGTTIAFSQNGRVLADYSTYFTCTSVDDDIVELTQPRAVDYGLWEHCYVTVYCEHVPCVTLELTCL